MTIKINGTNTTAQPSITGADTDTGLVYGTDQVQVVTGGTTRATVDSSGRLGIGTSPANKLHVSDTSGSAQIRITGSSGSSNIYADSNIYFQPNGSTAVTFASSGNVMIGTTSAASYSQLTVRATSPQLSLYATPGQVSCLNMGDTDDNDIGQVCYSNSDNSMRFVTNSGERMRILPTGGLTFNGDTAAANALDDYEEGSWTPILKSGSNVISYSGGTQSFTYTKIGNIVSVRFSLQNATLSGTINTSIFTVSGIPFHPIERTTGHSVMFYSSGFRLNAFPAYSEFNNGSGSVAFLSKASPSSDYTSTHLTQIGSGSYLFWTHTYKTGQ